MTAKWEYFYELFDQRQSDFDKLFNNHLNRRAAEGWELVSAPIMSYSDSKVAWHTQARLIWRR
jgi:hypothetical protein